MKRNNVLLLLTGFISMLGQVAVLRELSVAFYGIELIYILSIGLWLIGTAAGASLGRMHIVPREKNILLLIFFTSFLLPGDIAFIRGIRHLFQGVPGSFLPFFTQITAMAAALIPLSFLMGLLFQWTAKRFVELEGTLARAYSVESAGGIAGGLASTLFLYIGLQNFSIAILCSASALMVISYYSWKDNFTVSKYLYSAGLAALLFLYIFSPSADRWMTSWNNPNLIESKDTPYGRVTVSKMEDQISVFEDGALSYDTESIEAEEFIQLSTLQAARLNRVLVLGNGFGGILSELLKLPVKGIDYAEINQDLIGILQKHMSANINNSLKDKRVNIIYGDPRKYLSVRKQYDAIIAGMPEPNSAQSNRFYTVEFFRECSMCMNEGAIIAFKIPSSENLWTPQLTIRNKSIYNALRSVFPNVIVLPGTANIFIASRAQLPDDPSLLSIRFKERKPETKLVTPEYINYIYTNDRYGDIRNLLEGNTLSYNKVSGTGQKYSEYSSPFTEKIRSDYNSDLRPACYSYTLSIWLSKFFTGMTGQNGYLIQLNSLTKSAVFWVVLIAVAGIIISFKKLSSLRRFILAALAGFTGMIMETVIILNYQSKSGILYRDIGILLMTFMAGLAIGSYIVNKIITGNKFQSSKYTLFGVSLIFLFAAMNIIIYFFLKFDLTGNLIISSLLLTADGIFVAAVFAYASLNRQVQTQASMIPLYSADLLGGCIGSIAASIFFIPLYGILSTSLLMAATVIAALLFIK